MKILIYSGNYFPELTGVGKYVGEMSFWLAEQGHCVRVITTPPHYPGWKIKRGFNHLFWSCNKIQDVSVFRCPVWVPENPTAIRRFIYLASFALSSLPVALFHIFWRPNIVICIEPPLLIAPTGLFLALITGAKSVIHIQDFEVDAAFGMKFLKNSILRKGILRIEYWLLSKFDLVSTISQAMLQKLAKKNVPDNKRYLFPNWADLGKNNWDDVYHDRFGIPPDVLIALYSGNMGAKQGLELLGSVAKIFNDDLSLRDRIHFIFCGSGPEKKNLIEQCKELQNVSFLDLQPSRYLASFLSMADIHLLPQKFGVADLVMPSKLTGMLASGRPIVATATPSTEIANVVNRCGILVEPENPTAFHSALVTLIMDHDLRSSLGLAARDYAEINLDQFSILSKFESKLRKLL